MARVSTWVGWTGLLAAGILASGASASVRPFVFAGGEGIRTRTETLNQDLDPITIRDHVGDFQYGGGLRFFPSRSDIRNVPVWEIRLRYERESGDLPGNTFHVVNTGRYPYDYVVRETYSQDAWLMGSSFTIRPVRQVPQLGFSLEPALQFVTLKGSVARSGDLPYLFPTPASGEDKRSVHFGLLELGASWTAGRWWPSLEGFWVPARFQLSTMRRAASDWEGTFATLRNSFGVRVVYYF